MRRLLLLLVLLASAGITATSAYATKRIALVIGNAAYENVPALANPYNDASDMSAKLRALGFDVVEGLDLNLLGFRRKISQFVDRLGSADLAMVAALRVVSA